MVLGTKQSFAQYAPAALIGQVALDVIGMTGFAFAPRDDQPALLYPINAHGAASLPEVLSRSGTLIVARGGFEGSYVIRGPRPGFAAGLIGDGIIVLNASAPGCGPIDSANARANVGGALL